MIKHEETVLVSGSRLLEIETLAREVELTVSYAEHAVTFLSQVVESEEVDNPVGLAACLRIVAQALSEPHFRDLNKLGEEIRGIVNKDGRG